MSLRDLLIFLIVGGAAAAALMRPWIGTLLWAWLSIMNPHRYAWGAAYTAPVATIAAGATLVGLAFTRERQSPLQGAPVYWLGAFAAWITISWLFGMDPASDQPMWEQVMKIYFMTFVTLMLLNSKMQLLAFACVTFGSIALLATKGGVFTILTGGNYRVWGPPESFIADNNDFAAATLITIPMLYFLSMQLPKRWMRLGLIVVILLCAASALGSQSRGGFLALVGMGIAFWVRSPHKLGTGALIAIVALMLVPMMPDDWFNRMETITSYNEDASAMGRINAWHVAWQTALHYPTGGGMSYQYPILFEQYGPYESTVRAAHSIYFQILGNHGFFGLFLFIALWVSTYRSAGWLRRNAHMHPESRWASQMGSMVQVSLITYAVGGAFLSLPYFDLPYNIMILTVLTRRWVERRAWETASASAPLAHPATP